MNIETDIALDEIVRDFTQVIPRSKSELRMRIVSLLEQEKMNIKSDLLNIADAGEHEDLRREVIDYFN